jgi:hypothetical protein
LERIRRLREQGDLQETRIGENKWGWNQAAKAQPDVFRKLQSDEVSHNKRLDAT